MKCRKNASKNKSISTISYTLMSQGIQIPQVKEKPFIILKNSNKGYLISRMGIVEYPCGK